MNYMIVSSDLMEITKSRSRVELAKAKIIANNKMFASCLQILHDVFTGRCSVK